MVGRFGYAAAAMVVAALVAGPYAYSVAASVPAFGPTTARIGLNGADPDGLQQFATAVSDPASAQYRHFLTPEEVQARFGPTAAQLKKVRQWVARSGLKITGENSHWIDVAGTSAQVGEAFGHVPQRRTHTRDYAAVAASTVPAELAGAVSSVAGLVPQKHGLRQFSYRVAAGRRGTVSNPLGQTQPSEPGTPNVLVNPGGPMQPSGPAAPVDPGGPMQSTAPSAAQTPAPTSTACSAKWGDRSADGLPQGYTSPEPLVVCGYKPSQLRAAYGITKSGFTGKGAVLGIVDAYGSPTMRADADRFATSVGDEPFADGQYLESGVDHGAWRHLGDGACETPATWGGDEALDVELAHGLAPQATVHYFGAASCADRDIAATLAAIVDHHWADTVTGSFGEIMHSTDGDIDPALIAQEDQVFATGAAEGIGFSFATGDCGDQAPGLTGPGCDPASQRPQVEWPAASPWVTAVGGTALALAADGTRQWEVPMGDLRSGLSSDGTAWAPFPGEFYFGGGGGASEDFDQPAYQKGVVPEDLAHSVAGGSRISTAMRTVPDVAMDGDLLTAVLTGHTDPTLGGYGQDVIGGTSAAAPMFAAVQADAGQAAGGTLGFANPALYKRAATKQFTDIVDHPMGAPNPISAVVDHGTYDDAREAGLYKLDSDHGLSARKGYDTATGLGSPNVRFFASFRPKSKK
jgi:subtilase family serine protease